MKRCIKSASLAMTTVLVSGLLTAQADVKLSIHTGLPVSAAWRYDVLGIDEHSIILPPGAGIASIAVPPEAAAANGDAMLFVQAGDHSRSFRIRGNHHYHISASDSAIALQSSDSYHEAYAAAQSIFDKYRLYHSTDEGLLRNLAGITAQYDSIKSAHPDDNTLHATLDYYRARRSLSPLIQSKRSPEIVAYYRQMEKELVRDNAIHYNQVLYWSFLEDYYTWKANIKAFSEFEAPDHAHHLDRFKGELQLQGNDTVAQIAALYKINSSYKGEGSKNAEAYSTWLEEIEAASLHPVIAHQTKHIRLRIDALAVGRMAADFKIFGTEDDTLALSDFAGKALVLLDFWFVGCSPCKRDIPELKSLHTDFAERLKIIAVNPLGELDKVAEYRLKHNIPYTMGVPADKMGIKDAFNVRAYPNYVLLQSNGTVALYAGSDLQSVRRYLETATPDAVRNTVID